MQIGNLKQEVQEADQDQAEKLCLISLNLSRTEWHVQYCLSALGLSPMTTPVDFTMGRSEIRSNKQTL